MSIAAFEEAIRTSLVVHSSDFSDTDPVDCRSATQSRRESMRRPTFSRDSTPHHIQLLRSVTRCVLKTSSPFTAWTNRRIRFPAEEEAQGDEVFKRLLHEKGFRFGHPLWPKFCGAPPGNQSAVVIGSKGSGKTAMRLALETSVHEHNRNTETDRTFLVKYDDFSEYLSAWHTAQLANNPGSWWSRLRKKTYTPNLHEEWSLTHLLDGLLAELAKALRDELLSGAGQTSPGTTRPATTSSSSSRRTFPAIPANTTPRSAGSMSGSSHRGIASNVLRPTGAVWDLSRGSGGCMRGPHPPVS